MRGPLVLEATALPTEPQPLPHFFIMLHFIFTLLPSTNEACCHLPVVEIKGYLSII